VLKVVITVPLQILDKSPSAAAVPAAAVGIGFTGALGAVLLEVLHSGGASVAISLIAGSTIIIVTGFVTFGILSRPFASAVIAARTVTDPLQANPFRLDLPQNWNQQSIQATVPGDEADVSCEVLAFVPQRNGSIEALVAVPDGYKRYSLAELKSVVIALIPDDGQRRELSSE
jgi:hypothetical protein